jgi:hypothetical protein
LNIVSESVLCDRRAGENVEVVTRRERVDVCGLGVRTSQIGRVNRHSAKGGSEIVSTVGVLASRDTSRSEIREPSRSHWDHAGNPKVRFKQDIKGPLIHTYYAGNVVWRRPDEPWLLASYFIPAVSKAAWIGGVNDSLFFIDSS